MPFSYFHIDNHFTIYERLHHKRVVKNVGVSEEPLNSSMRHVPVEGGKVRNFNGSSVNSCDAIMELEVLGHKFVEESIPLGSIICSPVVTLGQSLHISTRLFQAGLLVH